MLIIYYLLVFIVFLLLISFFSSSEILLTILNNPDILPYIRKNKNEAIAKSADSTAITKILIWTNIATIGASVSLSSLFFLLKERISPFYISVFSLAGIFAVLYFGEIMPKLYMKSNWVNLYSYLMPYINFSIKIISPVERIFSKIIILLSEPITKSLSQEEKNITYEDLKVLVSRDDIHGFAYINDELMSNVVEFLHTKVGRIMKPKTKIFAVDINDTTENIIGKIIYSNYSRVPVYDRTLDNIKGIIYAKDLLIMLRNKNLVIIDDLVREAVFVPESKNIVALLEEFRKGKTHIAIVVDEYGATEGIVTLEDILEEITGEIYDEYDKYSEQIIKIDETTIIAPAETEIKLINKTLGLNLPEGEFVSIGGLVMDIFGYIPLAGEKKVYNDITIEILEATPNRIGRIKITKS